MNAFEPIIVEQTFGKTISVVWEAITEPNHMKQWFFAQIIDFKAEKGFETEFPVEFDGYKFTHLWKIEEVIPQQKIVYNWRYAEYKGEAKVVFELFGQGETTILRLTSEVINAFPGNIEAFSRESAVNGWTFLIKNSLKEYFEN